MKIPFHGSGSPDILARIVDHKRSTLARSRSNRGNWSESRPSGPLRGISLVRLRRRLRRSFLRLKRRLLAKESSRTIFSRLRLRGCMLRAGRRR